jgi:RNA polymerase sigma factor (sigma-70 family)
MPTSIIEHLRRTVLRGVTTFGDAELLGRFVERRDESALAALVERHGPMVWGVCRRLLSHHDAEDALQATFLVLVRKAASVVPREMVGNWLYGVAHQAALQARRAVVRRRARETQVIKMPDLEAMQQDQRLGEQPLLDQELSRLPDNYRAVIVLCDLEGRTRKEVARQFGVPEGTVAGRLARARAMLAKRLARRGVTSSGAALASVLATNVASASVPASVVSNAIRAANLFAAGRAAAVGVVSPKVAALIEGVLNVMLMGKLKAAVAVVLVLGFLMTGATVVACRMAAGQSNSPPVGEKDVKASPEPEPNAFTAWGKKVDGLQAGLGYKTGKKRVYRHGETVAFVVRVRNVGKATVKFSYFNEDFPENPPLVTDDKGKPLPQIDFATLSGLPTLNEVELAPGKEVELCEMSLALAASVKGEERRCWTLYGTGKFQLRYDRVGGNITQKGLELLLGKLDTGKLEFEVKEAKQILEKKEDRTAWGEEAGGLQLGLALVPDDKTAYHTGEAIKFEVRVRNVSKAPIAISYGLPESEPKITDTKGEKVSVIMPPFLGIIVIPTEVVLKPGETTVLFKREIAVEEVPARKAGLPIHVSSPTIRVRAGKYKIAFDEFVQRKLTTGTVEVEVKDKRAKVSPKEKAGVTAWGKEVGGLQAGLDFRPGEKRTYRHGETITLVVRLRNVGNEAVKFEYVRQFLDENPPTVTNAAGKTSSQLNLSMLGFHVPQAVTLNPGKEIELESRLPLRYLLSPPTGEKGATKERSLFVDAGKVTLQYERVFGNSSSGSVEIDPALSKLATGKLELEIARAPAEKE